MFNMRLHEPIPCCEKLGKQSPYTVEEVNDFEWEIVKVLEQFPHIVKRATG